MVPEGGRHPQDVGAYAPLCGPTQSNIFGMAKHALLSVGNSTSNSTALIIGANVGRSGSDFVFNGLKKLSLTRKIFVEPMPTLHRELARAVQHMPRAIAVQAAVSDDATRATLSMFCLGKKVGGDASRFVSQASETVRAEVRAAANRSPPPHAATTPAPTSPRTQAAKRLASTPSGSIVSEVCSLTPERLVHSYDFGNDTSWMRPLITETRVPMLTPTQLVERYVPSGEPVRYLQIDVEGMDDRVVGALPFGSPNFAPEVVVFEFILLGFTRTRAAIALLQRHGYAVCIPASRKQLRQRSALQNILAWRNATGQMVPAGFLGASGGVTRSPT
jgi:hypothetical protein